MVPIDALLYTTPHSTPQLPRALEAQSHSPMFAHVRQLYAAVASFASRSFKIASKKTSPAL